MSKPAINRNLLAIQVSSAIADKLLVSGYIDEDSSNLLFDVVATALQTCTDVSVTEKEMLDILGAMQRTEDRKAALKNRPIL